MKKFFEGAFGVLLAVILVAVSAVAVFAEDVTTDSGKQVEATTELEVDAQLNFGTLSEKGKSYTSSFSIKNTSEQSAKVQLEIDQAQVEAQYGKAADWLVFVGGKNSYDIAAGVAATVRMRINVPEDAPEGSQYAVVRVKSGDDFNQAVLVRLDIAGDGLKYSGSLQNSSITPLNLNGKLRAEATVANNGTAGFKVKHLVQMRPGFDGSIDWEVIVDEEREVKPGSTETFVLQDYATQEFGVFRVEQKVAYVNEAGESVEITHAQIVVCCPWWVLAIFAGIIIITVVVLVICKVATKKKHAKKKSSKKEAED